MKLTPIFQEMEIYVRELQDKICKGLEIIETAKFTEDKWNREEGGGGVTRIIEGEVIEKGGVNISKVDGLLPEGAAKQIGVEPQEFAATGLSLVIHPFSPRVPTIHMNIRMFETESGKSWFGGGVDLTPYYPNTEDFKHFHGVMKKELDFIDKAFYPKFKEECDRYFRITHRNEMRGIGGVFFDYLPVKEAKHFELVKRVGDAFLPAYIPIIERRKEEVYREEDKEFQLLRRGRYVEFNLVYDRGTTFGLKTGGRTESILMSLPPEVKFKYNWKAGEGSVYAEMEEYYQPREWV
jgi:coproporphyrinogen III oxidase